MKRLLYTLLLCGIFASCASDDVEPLPSDRIKSVEISSIVGYGIPVADQTHTFEYDAAGRLRKVNDKVFYYNAKGRVEFSRIERKLKDEYRNEEYVERLSYRWDALGRLKSVLIDSLYQRHQTFSQDGSIKTDQTNLSGSADGVDLFLATFSYEGTNPQPSYIKYREMFKKPLSPFIVLGAEEEVNYSYEGANVSNGQAMTYESLPVASTTKLSEIPYPIRKKSAFTYLTSPNYLRRLYTQLGFHPFHLHEVVSTNSVATSKITTDFAGEIEDRGAPPEGSNVGLVEKTTYSYRFNALDLPTEIVGEGEGGMQRTLITYE